MPAIEARDLTKVYRTYRKESGLWGAVKGLVRRRYDETRAADALAVYKRKIASTNSCQNLECAR